MKPVCKVRLVLILKPSNLDVRLSKKEGKKTEKRDSGLLGERIQEEPQLHNSGIKVPVWFKSIRIKGLIRLIGILSG